MQRYFKSSKMDITQEEVRLIFKLRCRVTDLKTHECGICSEEDETYIEMQRSNKHEKREKCNSGL